MLFTYSVKWSNGYFLNFILLNCKLNQIQSLLTITLFFQSCLLLFLYMHGLWFFVTLHTFYSLFTTFWWTFWSRLRHHASFLKYFQCLHIVCLPLFAFVWLLWKRSTSFIKHPAVILMSVLFTIFFLPWS